MSTVRNLRLVIQFIASWKLMSSASRATSLMAANT
eukprot:gene27234-32813_t